MGHRPVVWAGIAALALLVSGTAPTAAQAPAKTEKAGKSYTVTLDAEKDYFAAGTVTIIAKSRAAGEVEVGAMDLTIRRTKTVSVPADASELIVRTGKDITAKLRLTAASGTIIVRPLSSAGSASGIAWMLGRRNGIAVERLHVEFAGR
jgi:hypothetical protein